MNTYASATKDNKAQSAASRVSRTKSDNQSALQFVDSRQETIQVRKLQEMANNSPQVNPTARLEAIANNHSARQRFVQTKENKTGLPDNLKSGVEILSGYSMDDVKVHYNSGKPTQLQAHAYAQGTDIHIAPGQEKHLPHEAWHVVQQKQGRVKPSLQMKGFMDLNDGPALENEVDEKSGKSLLSSNRRSLAATKKTNISVVLQARFIRSNKTRSDIPNEHLDLIAAILKAQDKDVYEQFILIRKSKKVMSFFKFMDQQRIDLELRRKLIDIIDGKAGNDLTDQERNPPKKGVLGTLATPFVWLINQFGSSGPDKFKLNDRSVFMRNNCLINAIARAAGILVTDQQIIQIRTAVNQPVGEMLFATPRAIQVIRQVLHINNRINITYANLIGTGHETEHFAGGNPPLNIQHDGVNHFYFDRNQQGKKGGSLDFHLVKNLKLLNKSDRIDKEVLRLIIVNFNEGVIDQIGDNEKRLLMWLQSSLSSTEFDQMCRGGQIRIHYNDTIFKKLISMGAERRKSSHYRGIIIPTAFKQVANEHYGIDGHFFPTILFGLISDKNGRYIYIQPERNSYNPSAKLTEKIHHVFDAAKYASEWKNQGPYGESEHTDVNPMGVTENPQPGLRAKLSPYRLQSIPLILLHQIKKIPSVITKHWYSVLLFSLIAMFNIMKWKFMGGGKENQ